MQVDTGNKEFTEVMSEKELLEAIQLEEKERKTNPEVVNVWGSEDALHTLQADLLRAEYRKAK
jgi:hypothetical protein